MNAYKRGDLVEMQFDTGCMGCRTLYGRIIAAGEKAFRIVWESGLTNRLTYTRHEHLIKFAQDTATAEDAMRAVDGRESVAAELMRTGGK